MLAGGLVYLFSFRRPLMTNLNDIWGFITGFGNGRQYKPLPLSVAQELWGSFFLSVRSYMDFRLPIDPIVTASDASETGGGFICFNRFDGMGVKGSRRHRQGRRNGKFSKSGFAGHTLKVPLAGYVFIEKDPIGRRVLENHFPCSM